MKNFFLLLFVTLSFQVFCQDISGVWRGFLSQSDGGISETYGFVMFIKQTPKNISGTTKIYIWDEPNVFGKMKFSGRLNSEQLNFIETRIIDENKASYAFDWCIKTGNLKYSVEGDSAILSGKWSAITPQSCAPGTITVKKYIETIAKNKNIQPVEIIEERQEKEGTIIIIPRKKITIIVSESAKEDGDTISLIFNDVVVLSKHRLTVEEYEFTVTYDPSNEDNNLVLYAHNVGRIPPNTAKIQIKSGFMKQEILLKSNLEESDIIHFELK